MIRWTEHWPGGAITEIHLPVSFSEWPALVSEDRACLVVDENLIPSFRKRFPDFPLIPFHASESSKVMDTVTHLHGEFLRREADRSWTIIAMGGGITTDTVAFAAATYMRGTGLILIPTSLLAQVDAAIGGKTGVNFRYYKNLIGTFFQPRHILIDPTVLQTLPAAEWRNGMAEVIKHACLQGPEHVDRLMEWTLADIRNPDALSEVLRRSIETKLSIVRKDMQERGVRRLLNLGHSFAHALEKLGKATHGEAVSIGLVLAASLSEKLGLADSGLREQIETVLSRFELPIRSPVPVSNLLAHMRHDKKRRGDTLSLVLLKEIGKPVVHDVSVNALEEVIGDLCQPG